MTHRQYVYIEHDVYYRDYSMNEIRYTDTLDDNTWISIMTTKYNINNINPFLSYLPIIDRCNVTQLIKERDDYLVLK